MIMLDFLRNLKRPKYEPFNRVEILEQNLIKNYNYLKSLQPQAKIWPVLKSNAYGHGLKQICQILNKTDCKKVIVDSYPEAQIVYRYFKGRVLILGEMPREVYKYCNFKRTEFCVYNLATLKSLGELRRKAQVHLFVNTGMNREGIGLDQLKKLINQFKINKNIEMIGLCSHFASADDIAELNKKQARRFSEVVELVHGEGMEPKWLHLGNSAGVFILNNKKLNAFRVGIGFYGYNVFDKEHLQFERAQNLKPALRIVSKVVAVQNLNPGDKVSYNEKFEVEKPGRVAVIPFGYTEGLDRRLSNKAEFKIKNKDGKFWVRIAGRVCMNLTCLDCRENRVDIGDEVEIISADSNDRSSVQNLADRKSTRLNSSHTDISRMPSSA